MTLREFTLAAMALLAPGRAHDELGDAIVRVASELAPLYAHDNDRARTVALLVAVSFRESSLRNDAKGDVDKDGRPTSFCAFQVHLPNGARTREGWSGADLVADPERCVRVGYRMLRESIAACAALPSEERLAVFARGSCSSDVGRRISRDRHALAERLRREVRR